MVRSLAIVGPTGSGKSAVALSIVERMASLSPSRPPIELVSVDAMQIYRGMDIGTAKPSADEQRRVPHHLIDLVDPSEEFTVARFQQAYRRLMTDMEERGVTPLLVGGTGLYVRAVVDGLDIPGQWPEIRARLEDEVERTGATELFARIERLDPVAAARIEPNNARRVVRALEVIEGSGRPFSSFGPGVDTYPPTDVVQVGLRWDRERLSRRIADRVHVMMGAGWIDEVARLARQPLSRTAAQALGYHELFEHLAGRLSLERAVETIVVRTRQYAVRQERWFRRDPRIEWFDMSDDEGVDPVSDVTSRICARWLERS